MHEGNVKLNESGQYSPIATTSREMLVLLGNAQGLGTRTDPILALPMATLAALESLMPPKHHLWHMDLLGPALRAQRVKRLSAKNKCEVSLENWKVLTINLSCTSQ